jgi:hypothetical protein
VHLSSRPEPYIVPSYSLTGDLLSFLRCGLQYRYVGLGKLPATRPAQLWFGQFIHGVLEECYRRFLEQGGSMPSKPEIEAAADLVRRRLAAQGLRARNRDLEDIGEKRASAAVTVLGPDLFPIISHAEVRLTGTRPLRAGASSVGRRAEWYEMAGIVDVITHVSLASPKLSRNRLVRRIVESLPTDLPPEFEVVVDYKGMRRPPAKPDPELVDYWQIYEWQLQTYAQLRSVQPDALPVVGGVLMYLNELYPTWGDLRAQAAEVRTGRTDVTPVSASDDDRALAEVRHRRRDASSSPPKLSLPYRLRRVLRVIAISPDSQRQAVGEFDRVVGEIETARATEQRSLSVLNSWPKNTEDEATCVACDYRTFCPAFERETKPSVPSIL